MCIASNAFKSSLSPCVSALGETPNNSHKSAWFADYLAALLISDSSDCCFFSDQLGNSVPAVSWRAQTLRSRPDAQFRFAGSVMRVARWAAGSQQVSAGFTDGGGSRGRCVSGRGGSRDHSPLPCALSFQTWPSDLNYIFMSASLSRWNRSVSAVFSGDAPGSSNFVSFHVLAPESLDSSCLKASKERGPCSVFEMGWHRFPRL